MRVAPALMAIGQGMIFLSDHLWPVVIGMAASGFGSGLAIPAATAAASLAVNADEQGGAIGLASSAGASGFIISPVLGFSLYSLSPAAPFMFASSAAIVLLAYAWISKKVGGAIPPYAEDVPEEAVSEPAAAPYQ
jgi:MFS family permease